MLIVGLFVSGVSCDWLGGGLLRLKTDLVRVGCGLVLLVMLVVLMPKIILAISSTVASILVFVGVCVEDQPYW